MADQTGVRTPPQQGRTDVRKAAPRSLSEVNKSEQEFWAICERRTGKDREHWEEYFSDRREKAVRRGMISAAKILTFDQMENLIRNYGFQPHNFYPQLVSIGDAERSGAPYKGPDRDVNPRGNVQDIKQVVRYRIKPTIIP